MTATLKATWSWAEMIRTSFGVRHIHRDMLPGEDALEEYLLEAERNDIVAALAAEALIMDAQKRQNLLDAGESQVDRLERVGLHDDCDRDVPSGDLIISARALGRLMLDARLRRAAAVARAAGDLDFVIADAKRRSEGEVIRWWAPENSGYETQRRQAGRYKLGTLLGEAWRYRAKYECLCVPAYIAERMKVTFKGEVKSIPQNWKLLDLAALEFPKKVEP